MKIDGKQIAQTLKDSLKKESELLLTKGITPHLAVVLVGTDPSSVTYVNQKKKIGEQIGVIVSVYTSSQKDDLLALVDTLNKDPDIHGIILQRPMPLDIKKDELDALVVPQKDVDGFHPTSPFTPPVSLAVLKIFNWIYKNSKAAKRTGSVRMHSPGVKKSNEDFHNWLKSKKILIIGRGETGGKPIADTFKKMNIPFQVAHSQTKNIETLTKKADIIISCVGKSHIVRHSMLTKKSILIGVGMHPEANLLTKHLKGGRMDSFQVEEVATPIKTIMRGDYDEEEIKDVVSLYTPIPGGVGPVNVACLFENLLKATKLQKKVMFFDSFSPT